jgi:hypothetical protein
VFDRTTYQNRGYVDLRSAQRTALLSNISKACEMEHLSTCQAESSGNTLCLYPETWLTVTERSPKSPAVLSSAQSWMRPWRYRYPASWSGQRAGTIL